MPQQIQRLVCGKSDFPSRYRLCVGAFLYLCQLETKTSAQILASRPAVLKLKDLNKMAADCHQRSVLTYSSMLYTIVKLF